MFVAARLPILSTIPRSATWFIRYVVSFLSHFEQGGRIDDRLTGEVVGDPAGPVLDFRRIRGGPLFRVAGLLQDDHLFIGHAVCPGFADLSAAVDWWGRTSFHVRGYDCFHEEVSYRHTPVDLAPYDYVSVDVAAMERAARLGRPPGIVLVYRNPLDQAASYFRYCQTHINPAYRLFRGHPLGDVPFEEYLFGAALTSYARQFFSYQSQAARHPDLVKLVAYEDLMAKPVETLTAMLTHLGGRCASWPMLADAVRLARREHMRAVEEELGRSLDGTRPARGSHMRSTGQEIAWDDNMRLEVINVLRHMRIDTSLIVWPDKVAKPSAALGRPRASPSRSSWSRSTTTARSV